MRILAFDTATRATTVALLDTGTGFLAQARDDPAPELRPRHTTHLLALIAEVLTGGGGWPSVDRIGVGVGPGTFTGLRIGVATARALSRARDIPLVGVSTLHSLALAVPPAAASESGSRAVMAVIDARRGEVFAAAWTRARPSALTAGEPLLEPVALGPEALARASRALGPGALAVGDGAVESRAVLEACGVMIPERASSLHQVDAVHHARLAAGQDPEPEADVRPEYLRLPDAELSLRAARKR